MGLTLIFKDNSRPRRATLRQPRSEGQAGGIVESVICDPGMSFSEAEKGLLDAAKEQGIKADDRSVRIESGQRSGPGAKLISHPGAPAREMTRRDRA